MFDPYYKWLGIPPQDQPPNHYRLLSVNLFEPDADVIDAAAERLMTYVRGCANGPHVAESQKVLNEISAARLCLLNPKKKSAYDNALKSKLAPAQSVQDATEVLSDFAFEPQKKKIRPAVKRKQPLMVIAPVTILLVVIIGGVAVRSLTQRTTVSTTRKKMDNVVTTAAPVVSVASSVPSPPVVARAEPAKSPFEQWTREVATLPAAGQADAVGKKLQELNPGFDGRVTPKIDDGVVTEFTFVTDNVSDISPVRALSQLKFLNCGSENGPGRLFDLSPLKGLFLLRLTIDATHVSDLTPLAGMPLTKLSVANTEVVDLTPLRGMRLTSFKCAGTKVNDLSPLHGMPLADLHLQGSMVSDLSPISGMPLKMLNIEATPVADLSPLKGMSLDFLACNITKVSDLSPIAGIPLKQLYCNDTSISDLSPLQGMPLKRISITPQNITGGIDALREIKSMEFIGTRLEWDNNSPPVEFWKRYDAGEFKKP